MTTTNETSGDDSSSQLDKKVHQDKSRLASKSDDACLDFHPIRIKGEPLSETIIRERR
jgi:hypothetical protein